MKSNILKLIFVFALVFAAVFTVSSCGEDDECIHRFSEYITADASGHWYPAVCGHSGERKDFSPHVGMQDDCICDVCSYVNHSEDPTSQWFHDDEKHWHVKTCGNATHKSHKGEHVGMDDCICDTCGYTNHDIDADSCTCSTCSATVHSVQKWLTDTATCSSDGVKTGKCANCGNDVTMPSSATAVHVMNAEGVCKYCGEQMTDGRFTLSVESVKAVAGGKIDVALTVANNPGVAGGLFTVFYGTGLTLTDVSLGAAFDGIDFTAPGNLESGLCKLSWDSIYEVASGNGTLVVLHFDVAQNVSGSINVEVVGNKGSVFDVDLNDIEIVIQNGTVTVTE